MNFDLFVIKVVSLTLLIIHLHHTPHLLGIHLKAVLKKLLCGIPSHLSAYNHLPEHDTHIYPNDRKPSDNYML